MQVTIIQLEQAINFWRRAEGKDILAIDVNAESDVTLTAPIRALADRYAYMIFYGLTSLDIDKFTDEQRSAFKAAKIDAEAVNARP